MVVVLDDLSGGFADNVPERATFIEGSVVDFQALEREEVRHAYSSHEKLRFAFVVGDPTPLEMGIGAMAEWAQRVGPRKSASFSSIEVRRGLPASWGDDQPGEG